MTDLRPSQIPNCSPVQFAVTVPTVLDRLIQQALHQVMQPLFEPEFSESSYGFRPGRNAHPSGQSRAGLRCRRQTVGR